MEMNNFKILFPSFIWELEGIESLFPYLGVRGKWIGKREHHFLSIILKPQIFHSPQNLEE